VTAQVADGCSPELIAAAYFDGFKNALVHREVNAWLDGPSGHGDPADSSFPLQSCFSRDLMRQLAPIFLSSTIPPGPTPARAPCA